MNLPASDRMHILIATGQDWTATTVGKERAARVGALAAELTTSGHAATVVVPAVRREPPAFRAVNAVLADPHHEHAVAATIRAVAPDVVHVVGCGGGTSIHLAWIARSLGVPCCVEVEREVLLCHRGDLVHAAGEKCEVYDDAERCAVCCRARTRGRVGLSAAGVAVARATTWLGDLAPFPTPFAFRNRRDMVAAALSDASTVIVLDDGTRQAVVGVGVPSDKIHLASEVTSLALWRSLARP